MILLLIASYICYRIVFSVPKRQDIFRLPDTEQYNPFKADVVRMIGNALAIPYEAVSIRSRDGVTLCGKYYEASVGAPVQIMFHGYRSAGERDFCGGLPIALKSGYNVLLVDQRAHGKSGGRCLTFGVKERYDCLDWIGYVIGRNGADVKIILYGMSMGAATVLMAAGLALPENVKGIIADCGYTSPPEIMKKVMRDNRFPVWLVYPLVRLGGIVYGGFDAASASAADALTRCSVPVCLIHGEDDRFVPCEMSRTNYRLCAAKEKRLLTVPRAGHGISYFGDRESYLGEIDSFLAVTLK